jgi:tellurium resistance protein TerD
VTGPLPAAGQLSTVTFSIGWDTSSVTGEQDLDLAAFQLGPRGTVLGDSYFVFFNNLTSADGAVRLQAAPGGTATLPGDARERITVIPRQLSSIVDRVVILVSSYKSLAPFAAFTGAYIQVDDSRLGELAHFDLTRFDDGFAVAYAELYRDAGRWLLRATGRGYPDLRAATTAHGL